MTKKKIHPSSFNLHPSEDSTFIPQPSSFHDRWLSVDEIGDYLGVKRDTVYKWISEKGMPAHKIGRLWKFKKHKVDKWVESGGAAAGNEQHDKNKAE